MLDRFSKNSHTSNFMKICPVGAELFHTDGQTDMRKLTASSRNSAKVSRKKERSRTIALNSANSEIAYSRISKYVNEGPQNNPGCPHKTLDSTHQSPSLAQVFLSFSSYVREISVRQINGTAITSYTLNQ